MGDDICKLHGHYGREATCTSHHYYPSDGAYRCPGCGRTQQAVITRDLARKHKDRHEWR